MASQVFSIIKIGGEAARWIDARVKSWAAQRVTADVNEYDRGQWPAETRSAVDLLIDTLREHRSEPPILFHSEHADLWSMFDILTGIRDLESVSTDSVYGNRYELWAFKIGKPDDVLSSFRKDLKRRKIPQETCWTLRALIDCINAWRPLVPVQSSTILIGREVSGGLVMDNEMEASLLQLPAWLGTI